MEKRKIDVIVEARMTSSRLPGKTLMPASGKSLIEHMIERLKRIEPLSDVIIATTVNPTDDCIAALCKKLGTPCFRGSEEDVLGRVVKAAQHFKTDVIVEITGDNPLIAPEVASEVVRAYLANEAAIDYVANDVELSFPIGWNARAFSTKLLEAVERATQAPVDREHVVNYICKRPKQFRMLNVAAEGKYRRPELRLTMDEQADYELIRAVFEALYPSKPDFSGLDTLDFLDKNPRVRDLNKKVVQRTYAKS